MTLRTHCLHSSRAILCSLGISFIILCLIAFTPHTALASPLTTAPAADTAFDKQVQEATTTGSDIMLGVFNAGDEDPANRIYATYDGKEFIQIATTYDGSALNKPYSTFGGSPHYAQTNPSIIFHNGYFWNISGWQRRDGKIWPVISYSPDLLHWTHPEGSWFIQQMNKGYNGIAVDKYPIVNGKAYKNFDIVAPEWGKGSDGSLYIIVSCGYWGAFHGRPGKDQMTCYTIKVKQLSCAGLGQHAGGKYYWPNKFVFKPEKAKRVNLGAGDFIDGAIYSEGKTTYLAIKKNYVTNQLYKTTTPNNPSSWKLVNAKMNVGFEGPSITKFKGTYYLFTDRLYGMGADGVRVSKTKNIQGKWPTPTDFPFVNGSKFNRARHGSVITLKAGTKGWKAAKKLLDQALKKRKGKPVYWLVNKKTGENLYTTSTKEAATLCVGKRTWTNKGIKWYAPKSGGKAVYRLVNLKTGDHLYTMSKRERDTLVKNGTWRSDFSGKAVFTSGGKKPIYRLWSKWRWQTKQPGTHVFATSTSQVEQLVREHWKNEGIKLYGVSY